MCLPLKHRTLVLGAGGAICIPFDPFFKASISAPESRVAFPPGISENKACHLESLLRPQSKRRAFPIRASWNLALRHTWDRDSSSFPSSQQQWVNFSDGMNFFLHAYTLWVLLWDMFGGEGLAAFLQGFFLPPNLPCIALWPVCVLPPHLMSLAAVLGCSSPKLKGWHLSLVEAGLEDGRTFFPLVPKGP